MGDDSAVSILPILKQIPLFSQLNETENKDVISKIELQYFPANYEIFHEGDIANALYIIKKGLVQISKGEQEANHAFAALGEGDFFGEMALMSDAPRSATISTIEESEIFVLKKEDFFNLVSKSPEMAFHLSDECLRRIKENENTKV